MITETYTVNLEERDTVIPESLQPIGNHGKIYREGNVYLICSPSPEALNGGEA